MSMLTGGDELFFHPAVVDFFNRVMRKWKNNGKPIALLLGCTLQKPYSKSFIHRKIIGLIQKHDYDNVVQQFIIGEPLVVCPREWENIFPASHYDFHPEKLKEEGQKIFVTRLRDFFIKFNSQYRRYIIFAPNHHRKIIIMACDELFKPIIVPYNIYNLPKLRNVIEHCIYGIEQSNAQMP